MLFLISTPIGNLADITFRAIEILNQVDCILCEDTRHSLVLLNHYNIRKPLIAYHKDNEQAKTKIIVEELQTGKRMALISDAGSPGIADPGEFLVRACIAADIPVSTVPGPCAVICALTSAGMATIPFQFIGFLPRKEGELRNALADLLTYSGTTICYESPNRLFKTLRCLEQLAPSRPLAVAREMTKRFEEIVRGTATDLLTRWPNDEVKGEIVLLISGHIQSTEQAAWQELSLEEHVAQIEQQFNLSKKEAIKLVANLRGLSKRAVYKNFID